MPYTLPRKATVPQALESAQVVAGKGIVGDRNVGLADCPAQNVTFIEFEEIEVLVAHLGTLGEALATDSLSRQDVVRALLHRGGLRPDVLGDGELTLGMPPRCLK